ncbi:four helix bundle protein [Psychroflexus sp. YR1-1]|uniref:Four helix bundle protein n=1 Tax=Psychroflexus aurantiacus TaxID=2709310 RepID=A0A6B3QZ44_9FLAO|nr:four helix bundle protein [Psychroflexus aurantiacus]NEV93583.1 four helix bundle protein [Psychroflexus aurantiacus]
MHDFKNFKVWQKAIELIKSVFKSYEHLPNDEKFGIKSQIKRSAVSIASNLAEGAGRNTDKQFVNFINMSQGFSFELETQFILIQDLFNIENQDEFVKIF